MSTQDTTTTRMTVAQIDEAVDMFIASWCGDNAPHLMDTDDNAGMNLKRGIHRYAEQYAQLYTEKVIGDTLNMFDPKYHGRRYDVLVTNRFVNSMQARNDELGGRL